MKKDFWLARWENEELGFHESNANRYLTQYWDELKLASGAHAFVPLCGKSVDMLWLREQGCAVIGVELSNVAVQDFFNEPGIVPCCLKSTKFDSYEANGIRILCGDFFDLCREDLVGVNAVYDRASMVALPPEMREQYVKHMLKILPDAVQILLVTFTYPQAEMQGPPFSVSAEEVEKLYAADMKIRLLAQVDVLADNPRFKKRGMSRLQESVYVLTRSTS